MKKRIVSFLMALVMAVSLLPVSAFAVEDGVSSDVPVVVEQEAQTAAQQGNDVAIEENGIQTYANSEVTSNFTPVVTYTVGDDTSELTATLEQIGTRTRTYSKRGTTTITHGKIWLVSLPAGAFLKNVFWGGDVPERNLMVSCVFLNAKGVEAYKKWPKGTRTLAELLVELKENGNYIVNEKFDLTLLGVDSKDNITTLFEGKSIPKKNVKGFIVSYTTSGVSNDSVVIQISTAGQTIDKSALRAALDSVPTTDYYTKNDRWNGKTTSETGFWNELCAVAQQAQELYDNESISQEQYDKVAPGLITDLQAAIANLIPTDRVNATALYEALHTDWRWNPGNSLQEGWPENTLWEKPSADNCTSLSWQPYAKAVKDGQALLDKLYENGKPTTANIAADQQENVDKLAAAADAHKLVNKEAYAAAYDKYMAAKPEADALLKQYDPAKLKERDYTADSWKAYTDAYAVLKTDMAYRIVGGTTEDWKMLQGFNGYYAYDDAGEWTHYIAHIEALKNAYRALTSGVDVTVSFTYLNNFSALYPSFSGTSLYANSSLTLAAGCTDLTGLMAQAGLTFDVHAEGSIRGGCDTTPYFLLLVNGENFGVLSQGRIPQQAVQFHNGDDIRMFRIQSPLEKTEASSGYNSTAIFTSNAVDASSYRDSIALIDTKAPGTAKVGDKVKLSATVIGADLFNIGQSKSAAGITLFISDPSETETLSQPTHKTTAVTGADGSLQYVFTKPGWYTVAMFNVTPDELTFTDVYQSTTIGEYYSLYGGDYALIHVTEADDAAALLKQYRAEKAAEAKAYFDSFHDYDFTAEGYAALKAQYKTLTAHLAEAADLTALMDTYDADFARLKALGAAAIDHTAVIAGLRQNLSYLPDDLNGLNANYKQLVKDIQTVYGGLNSYQKKLLSANETKRLAAVAKIDAGSLKAPAKVTLEVDVNENDLPKKADNGNPYFGWPNIKWVVTPNVDGTVPNPVWAQLTGSMPGSAKAGDHAFIRYYLDTTDAKYWPVWSVDGGKTWNLMEPQTLVTPDEQKTAYDHYYLAEYVIPDDVVDGSTITFKVKMISKTEYQAMTADSEEVLASAKTAALSRLQTLYNSLGDKAKAAYNDGVDSIKAAASVTAVESAYQSAVVAMKKAAANYGKVQVIVENTTYSKKDGAPWDGTLVDTWVDLSADSTMMSCVAAALKTVNASCEGAESGYIASINGLGEFDGSGSAGWMGTLNDWFTNEGFSAFTVKNGNLADGDVIRIMFTLNGYGADLGGTWGNSDTTVKALTVDGAMLTPNFTPGEAGGQYDYTLIINGESASVKLTPTASNKNFQVKTFLNEKVTDRSEGSSFYKRTETIPVKAGDTIYLGCGAKNWLSMNNQAGNKQNSDGTWYALHVVNINAGASYVTDLIAKLPTSLKYETYTRSMNDVAAARAAYEVLAKGEQSKVTNLAKLVSLEKQIEGFTAVDAFKVQLAALPEAEKLSVNDREAVDAAEAAYKVLEQKDCLTVAEKEKAETVFAKMAEIKGNLVLAVEKQIDAIGKVTLENEAAVKAAQAAYDALTAEQKQLVNGEKVAALNAAVAKLAELKREKLLAEMGDIYASVGESLQAQVNKSAPIVGSIGGEWLALALARSGRSVPAGYYDNVVQYVKANVNANERLHNSKSTDNSRVILALTAIGKDPTNVGGHNLLKGLDSMNYINKQGINGPVFALIALDSHNYPTFGDVTRDVLIDRILSEQVKADGGWALGGASDVDITAMTIQALAPYYKTNAKVKTAVDKGLTWLSVHQQEDGGFASWGAVNSESCAQVIVALVALGIDPLTDSRFIKNGITALDALCGYYTQDDTLGKGFAHVKQSSGGYVGGAYNQMATEQAYYALNAYYRFANSQNRLYDMTDVCITHNFGAWTVTKAATCTESGISTRKCSVCDTEETMIVPPLGHSMTATAGKAATCTEAGNSAYWSCSRCGKYFGDAAGKTEIAKDSWIINALDHDVGTRGAVAATCYISGHGADTYCKRCGIVITAGATIPATGKHTYVDGVCTTCGTRNPAGGIKGDDLKVDSKDNTIVTGGGLTIKTDKPVTDEKLAEIKAAVENGSIVITVNNTPILQLTKEDKESDGGKKALMKAGADASGELKKELDKLAEKLDALRGDSSRKNVHLEKIIDVTVELVKTNAVGSVESVAQLTELPRSVTVTVSITNELYDSLKDKRVCVVRSHTDANGNVTTAELPATLGGTRDNYVLTFQTDRASTFAIVSYAAVSSGRYHYTGGTTTGKVNSSNTGDDSQMTIWLGSAVMAAVAVVVLTYKKKRASK